MILIISESKDHITRKVIDWIIFKNKNFILIDEYTTIHILKITLDNFKIQINDNIISSDDINGYWYRKGTLNINNCTDLFKNIDSDFSERIDKYNERENLCLINYIFYILENKLIKIGTARSNNINKLVVLRIARECELLVPDSLITQSFSQINDYFRGKENIISKPIADIFYFIDNSTGLMGLTYTNLVDRDLFDEFDKNDFGFTPSLVQEYIRKKYEIRVFYIKREIYSMAIFSQGKAETQIDFRRKTDVEIRKVPYKLPTNIEVKIHKLMEKLCYDTGSIDLIKSDDDKYYFLEVNPNGQFGMVSFNCNYYLEKKIADFLA